MVAMEKSLAHGALGRLVGVKDVVVYEESLRPNNDLMVINGDLMVINGD